MVTVPHPIGGIPEAAIRRKAGPIVLELHLRQSDGRDGKLQVHALFRPGDRTPATDDHWRARCLGHFINLRGYLMGQTG